MADPGQQPTSRREIPRWAAIVLALATWLIAIPLAHGVVPWAISTRTRRLGWTGASPGAWNLLGLIPLAIAAVVLVWILILAITNTPERVRVGLKPPLLMTRGPYRFTRNPMYVAELGLWIGWAVFFGSAGILAGFTVLWAIVGLIVLPREERGLAAAFGPEYVEYSGRVPRWFGRVTPGAAGPSPQA
jgi:protein-S-isoprenylcysteine O-methyltransferase Ste14